MALFCQFHTLLWLVAVVACQDIVLPAPPGPYNVTIRTSELIDYSRNESTPDAPTNQLRRMMVSMFSPVANASAQCRSPNMLPGVAKVEHDYWATEAKEDWRFSADFNRFKLSACSIDVTHGIPYVASGKTEASYPGTPNFPVVFFSPGLGTTRFNYNVLSQWLAAKGFFVMTIDHPYTADAIQFPDGSLSISPRQPPTWGFPELLKANMVRVADVRFLADQLQHNRTFTKLIFPQESQPGLLREFGIWGHSFGGATASDVVYADDRFKGGIDLDGQMQGAPAEKGLKKPFVLWNGDEINRTASQQWQGWWDNSTGFKRNIGLKNTLHLSFGDPKLLADLYPYNKAAFGSLDGKQIIEILSVYARDFFHFVLEGQGPGLLKEPSKAYPEVMFFP